MCPSGLRAAPLPVEHLDAELLAAPFAAESAFFQGLTSLDPRLTGPSTSLWRETERGLLFRFPGISVDELVIRRDHLWFRSPAPATRSVPLQEVLRGASCELIAPDAGLAHLRVVPERAECRQRAVWRWLTFSLPADLLLAAAGARSERLEQVSAKLRAQLSDRGVAEPHLHLRAALGFPELWGSLMHALALPTAHAEMLKSPGAEWDEGRGLAPLMLQGALVRLLLAAFLTCPASSHENPRGMGAYLESAARNIGARLGELARERLWRTLFDFAAGKSAGQRDFTLLRAIYARLLGPRSPQASLDPLACWFPATVDHAPDFGFTTAALRYLDAAGGTDPLFTTLFWQVVRARVIFYRHVVQRPMVPGLQWFSRTYGRLSAPRRPMNDAAFVRNALRLSGPGVRSVEVRVTPEDRLGDLLKLVCTIDKEALAARQVTSSQNPAPPAPEVGIIVHFSRSRGGKAGQGLPAAWARGSHDDPTARSNPSGYRFSGYYAEQRIGACTLANLLVKFPRMIERVRGVDLCTDELGVPLWVLLPLMRHVRQAGDRAAAYLRSYEGADARPLGVTVHAGEDFVHLLGGLRRVHESIELLELGENSRLGHAVALGISVDEWAARASRLRLPRGERMLDLLWAWRLARYAPDPLRSWLPWVEQELMRIAALLFPKKCQPVSAHELEAWWHALHRVEALRAVGFPHGPHPTTELLKENTVLGMLHRWLTDHRLFERSQEQELIEVEQEVLLVKALQAYVRGLVAMRGIAVEINPSSNLLIGHLGDLASHPLWRICPPPGISADAPGVRVCIGSDDPITFATSLPEEYQLLADALSGAGLAGSDVDAWISAAQQCGLVSRFTVPRSNRDLKHPMCATSLPPPL